MQQSRRTFVKNSMIAAVGLQFFQHPLFAATRKKGELTGIQLYSVRADMMAAPLDTLKKLAAMGYQHVEHANYVNRKFYGWSAKEFKALLDNLGLKMPSGHTVLSIKHWDNGKKDFTDEWKYTIEDAATTGQQYVISPSMENSTRKNLSELKKFMEIFNRCGELCNKYSMKFGYHNHDFEFTEKLGEETLYDIILTETDPKLVMQQLDIGNMVNGGAQALDIMKKYPGRFESMHVKDAMVAPSGSRHPFESCVLGKGRVPIKEVIDLGRKWGTKHFIIEQEEYQGLAPLESAKQNLAIMKNWGY